MALSKQRKILVAVALVTGVCFVADALFLGPSASPAPPASTSAAGADVGQGAEPKTTLARLATDRQAFGAPGVAQRLRSATRPDGASLTASRDLFFPNGIAKPAPVQAAPGVETPKPAPIDPATEFASRYKLRAVMIAGGQSVALINHRLVHVGQTVGGYKLVHLETKAARLEKAGITVRLVLSDVTVSADSSSR